jgi:hypothetical protein
MKRCPFCRGEIQHAALVCRHCGLKAGVSSGQLAAPKKKISFLTWVMLGFVALAGIGLLESLTSSTPSPSSTGATTKSSKSLHKP